MNQLQELFQALTTRIKSPFCGYFILSFLAFNWKPLFFLFFSKVTILERISFFESHTDRNQSLIYPFLVALFLSVLYPYANYGLLWLTKKASELSQKLQLDADDKRLTQQDTNEFNRKKHLLALDALDIEKAEQQERIENLTDEENKEDVKEKIESRRKTENNNRPYERRSEFDLKKTLGGATVYVEKGSNQSNYVCPHCMDTNNISVLQPRTDDSGKSDCVFCKRSFQTDISSQGKKDLLMLRPRPFQNSPSR